MFFIVLISIKIVELGTATTEQSIWCWSHTYRKHLPASGCREHLASSTRGFLNVDAYLEILQEIIILRLKSMEGIFQSSAKLLKNKHTQISNMYRKHSREAILMANVASDCFRCQTAPEILTWGWQYNMGPAGEQSLLNCASHLCSGYLKFPDLKRKGRVRCFAAPLLTRCVLMAVSGVIFQLCSSSLSLAD